MSAFFIIVGLVLTFLFVVVIHELGHLFAACLVGVKPEVFSVGFGKALWSRKDATGTRWQIAALPLGGYVRFVGDENAASLSSMSEDDPLPGSLRSVSRKRQAVVVLAGPFANIALTLLLLCIVPMIQGVTSHPWTIASTALGENLSPLKPGDQVVAIDAFEVDQISTIDQLVADLNTSKLPSYTIQRGGVVEVIKAPRPDAPIIGMLAPGSPADRAGLQVGDLLERLGGQPLLSWSDLQTAVAASDGRSHPLEIIRASGKEIVELAPELSAGVWRIGVGAQPFFALATETPTIGQAAILGIESTGALIAKTTAGLASSVLGRGDPCALDGPIQIGKVAGQAIQLGWAVFLTFIAVISLGLGLLNLLPIPILDGGHLAILGLEYTIGKPVSKRVKAVLFIFGVTLIVYLMLTATINDLVC